MRYGLICSTHGGARLGQIAREEGVSLFQPDQVGRDLGLWKWLEETGGEAVVLARDDGMGGSRVEFFREAMEEFPKLRVLPLGGDAALWGLSTDGETIAALNSYNANGGDENRRNLFRYLRWRFGGEPQPPGPAPLLRDGVFSVETGLAYPALAEYLASPERRGASLPDRWVGLVCHRTVWEENNYAVERALVRALEGQGIGVICAFSEMGHPTGENRDLEGLLKDCFTLNGAPCIDGLVNRIQLVSPSETLTGWGIPVFNAIVASFTSRRQWEREMNPLAAELPWAYTEPELHGLIEPTLIGVRGERGENEALGENVERIARRIARWVRLRHMDNRDKKLAIMLHNAPCSGVEATLGCAYELDAFESAARILARLREEGWRVDPVPGDGKELKSWILERKAYSDFRWTSVEDIQASGGCLYRMGQEEYASYYTKLSPANRAKIEELYGPPPGEGMVLDGDLIVTGLDLGNVLVMIEPKRGCYGAKCTGEVCKILQDPLCPPPHQYLAAHWYLEKDFGADALVQVGTHASLEYLPGKTTGLGPDCWPAVALGDMPQIDLYTSAVPGEALTAKRRGSAVIVDYLSAGAPSLSPQREKLARKIGEWQSLREEGNEQSQWIRREIMELLREDGILREFVENAENEEEGLRLLRQALLSGTRDVGAGRLHVFGQVPGGEEIVSYIREVWRSEGVFSAEQEEQFTDLIRRAAAGEPDVLRDGALALDAAEIAKTLRGTGQEMDALMNALSGRRVAPGIYGSAEDNGRESIPTGRNLFAMDSKKIPTRAAYAIGRELCDKLLEKYLGETGAYPGQVAMNMISLDITRSKGEQMSQMLCLMGIRPVWDGQGNVTGLEVIPLGELGRPRIDVVVRITGIMRDAWPGVIELMDRAVLMAASLEEPAEQNYIRAHSLELLGRLKEARVEDAERRADIRIFGDPPGAYGAGVDLALKASAWKDERDLARYFVEASSHAYGMGLSGQRAPREFVHSAGHTDVTYDITATRRYDVMSAGFTAEVQGGFALLAKMRGRTVRAYQGSTEDKGHVRVMDLGEKLRENLKETLFNPIWKEAMEERGYEGGGEIMARLQNAFSWQVMTGQIGDENLDRLVREYVLDERMREFLGRENSYALEEAARRFLELEQRDKWRPNEDTFQALRDVYLQIEGDMEDGVSGRGEIQAGSIEIVDDSKVGSWQNRLREVDRVLEEDL